MNLLSKFILPSNFIIQSFFLKIIIVLSCLLRIIFAFLLQLFVTFRKVLMLKFKLVVINLKLAFIARKVLNLLLKFCNLALKIQDVLLQDFLLRLNKLCFLLFVLNESLNFFTKFDLN